MKNEIFGGRGGEEVDLPRRSIANSKTPIYVIRKLQRIAESFDRIVEKGLALVWVAKKIFGTGLLTRTDFHLHKRTSSILLRRLRQRTSSRWITLPAAAAAAWMADRRHRHPRHGALLAGWLAVRPPARPPGSVSESLVLQWCSITDFPNVLFGIMLIKSTSSQILRLGEKLCCRHRQLTRFTLPSSSSRPRHER